jgi:serine phosphatase RsbU (regulator of sigma subunit)
MSQRLRSSENATIRDLRVKNQALQQALEDLKAAQSQLIAQERLEAELSAARKIQQGLLPREMPSLPGWRFTAIWQPAREVSGDFYDFLTLPDGKLGIVIGDVTGKGMPAALVMATTRSVLHAVTGSILALQNQQVGPGWLLSQVNDLLVKDMPSMMFVTCLILFLDPTNGTGTFANAGHCLPYQYNLGGAKVLKARGMPLGLLPGKTYDESPLNLEVGDSLLLYSDGLIEAHNPVGEMFGMERLGTILSSLRVEAGKTMPGETLIARLLQDMLDFSGPGWDQEDDATFVTIDRI